MALFAAAILAVLALSSIPAGAQQGNGKGHKQFGKHDQELIQAARLKGEGSVTVIIAAQKGQSDAVANGIVALGGTIQKRLDDISYIRASVPIDKIDAAGNLGAIEAADIDEIIPLDDPRPDGSVAPTPQIAPGASTPNINPYMPIGDTNAAQFRAAHPTWDGRGTTIGIIDSGVDLDHPALQTGKNAAGADVPKMADWVTATDPVVDGDPTWVRMATAVTTPTFTINLSQGPGCGAAQPNTYTVPAPGTYRFGRIREYLIGAGSEFANNLNRDADTCDYFGILLEQSTGKIWVDTNQNLNFADDMPMRAFAVNGDTNHFGTPAVFGPNGAQKSVPFVVQSTIADEGAVFGPPFGLMPYVNIGIVSGAHGTHVAGITSATSLFGGAMSGAAPGARLVSVRVCLFVAGCTAHALIEGMQFAVATAHVDVINMSIGGLPSLNDGNNARATLYNNLIDTYDVQMFISAGNSGAGVNTVGDPSVASKVMSVGSYIKDATWRSNYGSNSAYVDNMHPFSSRGPREDGGFKPNIIAPGAAISTVPTWQGGQPVAGTYVLPAGYAMFQGTSMASPQAAGGAALLISASKQNGNQHTAAQLRQALNSSSTFIARYGAYEQGNGLMNVSAAWDLLKQNIATNTFTSLVQVDTVLSGFLATPGFGEGIYEREGLAIGKATPIDYTITRTSGPSKSVNYNVSWVGNDGTFSSRDALPLKLNESKQLNVVVKPTGPGIHSAILNIDDPATPGIDFQTLNTVIVADDFKAATSYTVTNTGTAERNQSKSYFFNVPPGVPAFKIDLIGGGPAAGAGQIRFLRFHPYGVGIESNSTPNCYDPPVGGCDAGDPHSRTLANPLPGVWEVAVEMRRTSDAAAAPFTLSASLLGVKATPASATVNPAAINTPYSHSFTFTSLFGAFTGNAVGGNLGSSLTATDSLAAGAPHDRREVFVPPGMTSVTLRIGNASDPGADLDLYVYRCAVANAPLGSCLKVGQSADGDSEEAVTINAPVSAYYVADIDPFDIPSGSTTYQYFDSFAGPGLGSLTVTPIDPTVLHAPGSSWVVGTSTTALVAPAAGRNVTGTVTVVSGGAPLGSATVNLIFP